MKLITFLLFTFAVIFFSCGKDTVNNITNPPTTTDSLIYSKDSLVVYNSGSTGFQIDSLITNKYKIVFEASTNDSSSSSELDVIFSYYQDSTHYIHHEILRGTQINTNYNQTLDLTAQQMFIFDYALGFITTVTDKFIRAKNIKIYIVH